MAVKWQSRSRKLRTHIFKLRQSKATQKYGDALSSQIPPPVAYFLQHLLDLPEQPTPGDQVLKFLCPLPFYSSSHANARHEKGCGVLIFLRPFWGLVFILREVRKALDHRSSVFIKMAPSEPGRASLLSLPVYSSVKFSAAQQDERLWYQAPSCPSPFRNVDTGRCCLGVFFQSVIVVHKPLFLNGPSLRRLLSSDFHSG